MENETLQKILDVWLAGGPVMLALVLLSLLIYATAFQLVLYVYKSSLSQGNQGLWRKWIANPDEAEGRVGHIIRYTQDSVSSTKQIRNRFDEVRSSMTSMLDRRITYLNTLVTTAPLMGLLGTVIGMLQTFLGIATSAGAETAGSVASGISEALITTLTGLTVAIPGLFIVMVVRRQKHAIDAAISRLESLTLTHFKFD